MKKLYYAHPLSTYGSDTEKNDLKILKEIFSSYKIENPNNAIAGYKRIGMEYFSGIIKGCDLLVFRVFENNEIPTGVFKEIMEAKHLDIPVLEIGSLDCWENKTILTVEQTRKRLEEYGRGIIG